MTLRCVEGDLEKSITFKPAFDRRHPEPSQNYGIHGVDIQFILRGPLGATSFLLFTGWHLPYVERELMAKGLQIRPAPADLGYHAYEPRYEDQTRMSHCDILTDVDGCFYDGSGLNAIPVYERLLSEGDDGVWAALWEYYQEVFGAVNANRRR